MAGGFGGGVILAFAAVLWLLYLTPAFVQRRRYLQTERTAVRLQQTLRVLAETTEVPDEVRAEVTARSIADQHRALREAARQAESVSRPREAAAERALRRRSRQPREPRQRARAVSALAAARLRRSRMLAGGVLLVSVAVASFGLPSAMSGGTWLPLVLGIVGLLGALALLQRAATVAAAHRLVDAVDRTVVVPEAQRSFVDWQRGEQVRPTWTPVPVPRPLYLDREEARGPREDPAAAAARLDAAARRSDSALRAAQGAPEVVSIDTSGIRIGYPAPGVVHESGPVLTDLDAVLRRRRAG
ncbi:hypothetical protein QDR37_09535 [Amnibacterium sp. CER49]|uniref:hypothetical protein n=1 Tax=Amnibacterium sp. CER49 TaxID=3039161 RepID=UPI002449F545|nr:hypothetical protein [Amnibacterium sp. CER49]MDH2444185.1 hypothetical protein [Amnibacterium sp. CER49]